jgi:hypothetical protein
MKLAFLKRHFFVWGITAVALALLFIAGALASFWVAGQSTQNYGLLTQGLPLGWCRAAAYLLLIVFWPRLIYQLTRKYSGASRKYNRRPLIMLIIFYEVLIVQNPLAALFRWVR